MFLLKGCTNFFEVQIKNRPRQTIYLIGEYHNLAGNSLEFINYLRYIHPCSIDVIVEKPFSYHFNFPSDNNLSNIAYFRKPPLDHCCHPLFLPEPSQIRKQKNKIFFRDCIEPYDGKLKIWATDIRFTSIFYYVGQFISDVNDIYESLTKTGKQTRELFKSQIVANRKFKLWLKINRKFQKACLDFDLYIQDPEKFNENILKLIEDIFLKCPINFNEVAQYYYSKHIDSLTKILNSKDKSHLKIANKITTEIPKEVYKNWQEYMVSCIEDEEEITDLLESVIFFDLESMYRIYKILEKQKEGFIVVFAGSLHTKNIANLLELDSRFTIKEESEHIHIPAPHQIQVNIPSVLCTQKTELMRHFERKRKAYTLRLSSPKTRPKKKTRHRSPQTTQQEDTPLPSSPTKRSILSQKNW